MKLSMDCHHIGILTRNPETLIPFYTQGLGFSEGETRTLPAELIEKIFGFSSECRLTKLSSGSAIIEIFVPVNRDVGSRSVRAGGFNHWALEVEDKEAFIRILDERRVPVLKIDYTGRMIYFIKDPDGNLIEIYEVKQ